MGVCPSGGGAVALDWELETEGACLPGWASWGRVSITPSWKEWEGVDYRLNAEDFAILRFSGFSGINISSFAAFTETLNSCMHCFHTFHQLRMSVQSPELPTRPFQKLSHHCGLLVKILASEMRIREEEGL